MTRLDPDALAALEEERDFLLRSLDDLEREREAGDIDDTDYLALRDDYTTRAAAVLRGIEAGRARFTAARRPASWPRRLVVGAGLLGFAVTLGLLVAQASGRRDPGDTLTGDVTQTARQTLVEAGQLLADGETDAAVERYDEVLERDPTSAEAATYRGWALFLGGEPEDGLLALIGAAQAHPDYPDVHAFLAVVFERIGRPETALAELDRLADLDPPPDVRALAEGLRARLERQLGTTTTTTARG